MLEQTIHVSVIILVLYLSLMGIIIKVLYQRDKKLKLEKYEIDIKYGTDPRLENLLDTIVNNVFDEYRFFNLEYKDDNYVKEADEKQIIEDISEMVIQRMSPVVITQLSTYYNTESLGNIIAVKISTKVMEYRVNRNVSDLEIKK